MTKKKDLFQELQESNTNSDTSTKLNNDSINKLVDVISQPMNPKQRPTKFAYNPDETIFEQLEREQKKRGES